MKDGLRPLAERSDEERLRMLALLVRYQTPEGHYLRWRVEYVRTGDPAALAEMVTWVTEAVP